MGSSRKQQIPQIEVTKIKTLGGGNCLFNANAIALAVLLKNDLLDEERIGEFRQFLRDSGFARLAHSWDGLVKEIKRQGDAFPEGDARLKSYIQQQLRAPLRKLAVTQLKQQLVQQESLARASGQDSNLATSLEAAFGDYLDIYFRVNKKTSAAQRDDIFCRHPRMMKKFEELAKEIEQSETQRRKLKLSLGKGISNFFQCLIMKFEPRRARRWNSRHVYAPSGANKFRIYEAKQAAAKQKLRVWWQKEGIATFCGKMEKEGVWGGDMEAVALANYFGFNVVVQTKSYRYPLTETKGVPTIFLHNSGIHWSYMRPKELPNDDEHELGSEDESGSNERPKEMKKDKDIISDGDSDDDHSEEESEIDISQSGAESGEELLPSDYLLVLSENTELPAYAEDLVKNYDAYDDAPPEERMLGLIFLLTNGKDVDELLEREIENPESLNLAISLLMQAHQDNSLASLHDLITQMEFVDEDSIGNQLDKLDDYVKHKSQFENYHFWNKTGGQHLRQKSWNRVQTALLELRSDNTQEVTDLIIKEASKLCDAKVQRYSFQLSNLAKKIDASQQKNEIDELIADIRLCVYQQRYGQSAAESVSQQNNMSANILS